MWQMSTRATCSLAYAPNFKYHYETTQRTEDFSLTAWALLQSRVSLFNVSRDTDRYNSTTLLLSIIVLLQAINLGKKTDFPLNYGFIYSCKSLMNMKVLVAVIWMILKLIIFTFKILKKIKFSKCYNHWQLFCLSSLKRRKKNIANQCEYPIHATKYHENYFYFLSPSRVLLVFSFVQI